MELTRIFMIALLSYNTLSFPKFPLFKFILYFVYGKVNYKLIKTTMI